MGMKSAHRKRIPIGREGLPIASKFTERRGLVIPNKCSVCQSGKVPMPKRMQQTAAPLIPANPTIGKLRESAAHCQACDLWKRATQTVFGEGGGPKPRVIFVGEQPGDQEDIQGRPFVGPAGKILDKALAEAGIDRKEVYVTNAVKH